MHIGYAKFCHNRFILLHSSGKTNFIIFLKTTFCAVAKWWYIQEADYSSKTANLPRSNGIKSVFILQRLPGEVIQTVIFYSNTNALIAWKMARYQIGQK